MGITFTDKDSLDVSRRAELRECLRGFKVVFHLASPYREGPMTPARAAQSVRFARNVVEAAAQAGVERVVLMSSIRAAPLPEAWRGREEELNWPLVYRRACHAKERLGARGASAGLDVITVRAGRVSWPDWPGPALERAVWLSHEDCASLFRHFLVAPVVPSRHVIMAAVSAHSWRLHDTTNPVGWTSRTRSVGLTRVARYLLIRLKSRLKPSLTRPSGG